MMKKNISLFLAVLMFLNLINFTHASHAHAATSPTLPFVITDANDLLSLAYGEGDYILANDIDMTRVYWQNIDLKNGTCHTYAFTIYAIAQRPICTN